MATRQAYVEILRSRNGEYRWRLRAGNGEIVASGEGHTTASDAKRAWMTVERIVVRGRKYNFQKDYNSDLPIRSARRPR
jgi:uncharacterized protein